MTAKKRKSLTLTEDELSVMLAIISELDPLIYEKAEARALIYKCKAGIEDYINWIHFEGLKR